MTSNQSTKSKVEAFHFGVVTAKFYETWDFYTEQLGFRTFAESDNLVRLVHPSGAQLGVMRQETNELHPELVSATDGRGFWLSLRVGDTDALYQRLCGAGVAVVQPLEAGQGRSQSFTVRDPNGILIFVVHESIRELAPGICPDERAHENEAAFAR